VQGAGTKVEAARAVSLVPPLPTIDSDLLDTLLQSCSSTNTSTQSTEPTESISNINFVQQPSPATDRIASLSNVSQFSSLSGIASQVFFTKWSNFLPKFSTGVQDVLDKGKLIEEWDSFVAECAYHVIANGDMSTATDYSDFGRAIVRLYPCAGSTDGKHILVSYSTNCIYRNYVMENCGI
jgi:hypothetical protein